jgi:purine-binding chemotaxis protein CheW
MAGTLSKSKGKGGSRKKRRKAKRSTASPSATQGKAAARSEPTIPLSEATNALRPEEARSIAPPEDATKADVIPQSPRPASAISSRSASEPRGVDGPNDNETQVVTFRLAGEEYAIDILQVQEIVMLSKITRMPKAPHFLEGVINLRGRMVPIIDMRKRFELPEASRGEDTRIIIVDIGETVGIVVDGVRDVIRLRDSAISPPPEMIKGISAAYLRGIGRFDDRLLIMLDLESVLSEKEHEGLRDAERASDTTLGTGRS